MPPNAAAVSTADGRLARVPNAPKTPVRGFRIPDDLWRRARAVADERGESLSDVVRAALLRYVQRHERHRREDR
jgi:hypothetical protein